MNQTTIAAISTAKASAGISVIRISGDDAIPIAERVFTANSDKALSEMKGYTCALGAAYADGEKLDECIATVFRAPHSYTGENIVELSCHGGLYVTNRVLRAVYDAGAEPAQAGEFTKRAFLNGKLDLVEAEAVMDIIAARSRGAVKAALSVKDGALSKRIDEVKTALLSKAAHLSAWADYPEEDIPEVEDNELSAALQSALEELSAILKSYDNGRLLRDGIDTAIVGKPNVGKSTLMNLLAGYDKSIVTEVAGTTRDVVEESVNLDDIILNLSDTAGIHQTNDIVEKIGVDKAKNRLNASSLILCVFDGSNELTEEDRELIQEIGDAPAIAILNKADLPQKIDETEIKASFDTVIPMSAKNSEGVAELITAIRHICAIEDFSSAEALVYNERQRNLTKKAFDSTQEALTALEIGMTFDAVTVSIEEAVAYLCELTGERVTDEVVDRVFHNFCVGK
ncbi:MAG: tRNA uridine-5-carboxymethylaminomethyl(34) synthesis GTPase MnmE [Ruminococcus sp.]|nr:tRNA uridine-5-carboxymethylaminomethyl(34) synthesis GTPase MnmE [Ruminococcus sp.]